MKLKLTGFFSLNLQDAIKGAITSAITFILASLYPILNASRLPNIAELKMIGLAALITGLSYLLKNLFTPAPKEVQVDASKTKVVDKDSKEIISEPLPKGTGL